jgi:acyl-CoA synthetase (NDP forming)
MKSGRLFLIALKDQGFPGNIYPVNPEAKEIDGLKSYPSVSAIPGQVDLAIVLVPHDEALSVVRECATKRVKGVVLFTSGYRETGSDAGKALEAEFARIARETGMRIIGPNGMGIYSPKSGLSFFPNLSKDPGPVGIVSHSGSLTNILGRMGSSRGIRFSKVISVGNECDLSCAEFLTYLGQDHETGVIGCYLEGIKDGPLFLSALRKASLAKPVILWKLGLTPEGSRAAASHTGALAGFREIWEGVVRQGGGLSVWGFEAWVDAIMGFSLLPGSLGDRMAVVSGPGGLAVSAAEACGRAGLRLAELNAETRSALAAFIPPTGTSLLNPIDVGLTASMEIEIYDQAVRTAAGDPGVDAVVVVGIGLTSEANGRYTECMIRNHEDLTKPIIMVCIPGFDPALVRQSREAGVPFFDSAERAMDTYALVRRYQCWREAGVWKTASDSWGE